MVPMTDRERDKARRRRKREAKRWVVVLGLLCLAAVFITLGVLVQSDGLVMVGGGCLMLAWGTAQTASGDDDAY